MKSDNTIRSDAHSKSDAAFRYHISFDKDKPFILYTHRCKGVTKIGKQCDAAAGGNGYCANHKNQAKGV